MYLVLFCFIVSGHRNALKLRSFRKIRLDHFVIKKLDKTQVVDANNKPTTLCQYVPTIPGMNISILENTCIYSVRKTRTE